MLPPVVIELSPADAASPHVATLVHACTEAVSDGECRAGSTSEAEARALVIVSWQDEAKRAKIEIGIRVKGKSRWVSRELTFRDADPLAERWKTAGFVIGTLVGETEREAEKAAPKPPEVLPKPLPAPPKTEPTPVPKAGPAPRPATRLWAGLELVAGPGLSDGSWRFGAGLVAVYDVPRLPVLGSLGIRYTERPHDSQDLDVRWLDASAGIGFHRSFAGGPRLELRGEAVLERVEANLTGAQQDSAFAYSGAARLTGAAGLLVDEGVLLLISAESLGRARGTQITRQGAEIGRAPPLTWALTLGARVRLF